MILNLLAPFWVCIIVEKMVSLLCCLTGKLKDIRGDRIKENEYLCNLIQKQPKLNKALLCILIEFLSQVLAHSATNKMTSSDLAKLFAPYLTRQHFLSYKKVPPVALPNTIEL